MITSFIYLFPVLELYFTQILLQTTVCYIMEAVMTTCKSNRQILNVRKRYTPLKCYGNKNTFVGSETSKISVRKLYQEYKSVTV